MVNLAIIICLPVVFDKSSVYFMTKTALRNVCLHIRHMDPASYLRLTLIFHISIYDRYQFTAILLFAARIFCLSLENAESFEGKSPALGETGTAIDRADTISGMAF